MSALRSDLSRLAGLLTFPKPPFDRAHRRVRERALASSSKHQLRWCQFGAAGLIRRDYQG